ncbi:hypothetical protein HYX18_02415 [Candidatus Woesearchaeota archaeon]|nr:hypothetical protein [Candidatus Woesearchaeota archaeon]
MVLKKGQTTLFIILGIIIVILISLIFYFRTAFISPPKIEELQKETDCPERVVTDCIARISPDYIILLGKQGGYLNTPPDTFRLFNGSRVSFLCFNIPGREECMNRMLTKEQMEKELENALDFALQSCINVQQCRRFGQQYSINTPKKLKSDVNIGKEKVLVKVSYPVQLVSKTGAQLTIQDFSASLDYPLGNLYDIAVNEIINTEAEFGNFEQLLYMISHKGKTIIDLKKPYPDKLYVLKAVDNPFKFQFFVQGEPG